MATSQQLQFGQQGPTYVLPHPQVQALGGQEGVVQVQVCGEELWEIALLDHLQKHGGCRLKPLLVPVQEWMSTASLGR